MLGVGHALPLKLLPTEQLFLLSYDILEGLRKLSFALHFCRFWDSPNPTSGSKPSVVSKAG